MKSHRLIMIGLICITGIVLANSTFARNIRNADLVCAKLRMFIQSINAESDAEIARYLDTILRFLSYQSPDNPVEQKLFRIQGLRAVASLPVLENTDIIKLAINELVNFTDQHQNLSPEEKLKIRQNIANALESFPFINVAYEEKILNILLEFVQDKNLNLKKTVIKSLNRRMLIVKNNIPQELNSEIRQAIISLMKNKDNYVKIEAIRAVGDLGIMEQAVLTELRHLSEQNFSRFIGTFKVRPSQIENAKLAAEASITLLKLDHLENEIYEDIVNRFYALGEAVMEEMEKNSIVNYVSFEDKVNNLKETTLVFYKLLETIREVKSDDLDNIQGLGSKLIRMQSKLEKIFELKQGFQNNDNEISMIAALGLLKTEWILNLDRLLKLCSVANLEVAASAIDILGKFGTYYPQAKEEIFDKLLKYIGHPQTRIRTAAADSVVVMMLEYLPINLSKL